MNMPKGKPWTKQEVEKLRSLVEDKQSWEVIAAELHRSEGAIRQKCRRLGLEVVVNRPGKTVTTTSELEIPKELPSVQEALKILAAALKTAAEPGLDNTEIQRLQVVATLARTYENLLANFMRYREIEKRLVELEAKYARLVKEKA
jgi:hypothetical protein